ncbi:MAG TPA: hypothetical protein VFQ53_20500 [Kofleriaceae bacterium]|nr:hypothetical protein [Kofleriaceae bacterium]
MPIAQAQASQKFRVDKSTSGDITLLTLSGVIDEHFEGKKVAEGIKTKKLVVNLREVRRFASWGMAEWMDFIRGNANRDMYLVECSTHALNQFSLVTGLLGHTKLTSFYLPHRCPSCGEEFNNLFVVPVDRAALRDLGESEQPCPSCGAGARVDKYVVAMGNVISDRPAFDIDDEVVGFLRSELKYNVSPDVNRFRAYRQAAKGFTYLRLSGNVTGLQPDLLAAASEGTTVVDLAGVNLQTFDAHSVAPWRTYVETALPKVTSLQILDCPPDFLENAVHPEDLEKVKVRTFGLSYRCYTCNTTTTGIVDVAPNLEFLVDGMVPPMECTTCKSKLEADVTPELSGIIRRLPARGQDPQLEKFLRKARREPVKNLEDALTSRPKEQAKKPTAAPSRGMYLVIGLLFVVVAGLGVLGFVLWNNREGTTKVVQDPIVAPRPTAQSQRPSWILSDQPGTASCQDLINRFVCVGISLHRPTRNEAVEDANNAALEELVNTVALKVEDPYFKENVLAAYTDARTKALSALQAVEPDKTSQKFTTADAAVRKARKRVVELLQASGGAAVPAQRSDWYWEEYALEKGPGTEFLVFIRYDVSIDAVKALVDKYSTPTSVLGSSVITAFPALAWRYPDITGGVMVKTVGHPLSDAGVANQQLVMAVGNDPIADAVTFAKAVAAAGGAPLKLTVKAGDAPPKVIESRH